MEFGYVFGTHRHVVMPTEIGVCMYDPQHGGISYWGRKLSYDIDLEIWKTVTDSQGNKIGVSTRIVNIAQGEYQMPYDRLFHLPREKYTEARRTARNAYRKLRYCIDDLVKAQAITTLVFYDDAREKEAFRRAGVSLSPFHIIDIQDRVCQGIGIRGKLSLDRVSRSIKFKAGGGYIRSSHLRYSVPEKFRYLIKPHKSLGDAVRIMLLYREYSKKRVELFQNIKKNLEINENNLPHVCFQSSTPQDIISEKPDVPSAL
jgi:hypothetical protein